MRDAVLLVSAIFLLAPVVVGKILNHVESRRWKKRLQGTTDRYMTDEERHKQMFHMKRFK